MTAAGTTTYAYWPDDLLRTVTYPNGVVATHGYDLADRLISLTNGSVSSYTYGYDDNGNRTSQTEANGGTTETTTYTYDDLNRLKTVTYPADSSFPTGRVVTYGYDAVGNRLAETTRDPVGNILADKQGVFDSLNRLTALNDLLTPADSLSFTWDPNGNQLTKTAASVTTEYRYDTRNQLVEVAQGSSTPGRFQYDADGRRILKLGEDGLRQYVYDQTSLFAEYNDTGLEVAQYDYGADRLISLTRSGERRFYLFDALRSVTNLTTETGLTVASYHLDAWGNFRFPGELGSSDSAASKNRFAFTGYLWDQETALYYAKARFYDPEIGRFTSQDSFLGEITDPPSLHRYFYGNANPTRYIDPTGHMSWDEVKKGWSAAQSFVRGQFSDLAQGGRDIISAVDSGAKQGKVGFDLAFASQMVGRAMQEPDRLLNATADLLTPGRLSDGSAGGYLRQLQIKQLEAAENLPLMDRVYRTADAWGLQAGIAIEEGLIAPAIQAPAHLGSAEQHLKQAVLAKDGVDQLVHLAAAARDAANATAATLALIAPLDGGGAPGRLSGAPEMAPYRAQATPRRAISQPAVEVVFEHAGQRFYDVNRTARNPVYNTGEVMPIEGPLNRIGAAHPDVATMFQSFQQGNRGGIGQLSVELAPGVRSGQTAICSYCESGIKGMGRALELDELFVDATRRRSYGYDTDFYSFRGNELKPTAQGGARWWQPREN